MTLNKRIFLYFFSTFLLLTIAISFFQYQREKEFRIEHLNTTLRTYNSTIYSYLNHDNNKFEELGKIISFFPDSTLRVTVIDLNGNVLYDNSVADGKKLENHLHRPEIEDASTYSVGTALRHSTTTNQNYYYLANRYADLFVRTALPYNLSTSKILNANTMFIYFIIIVLLIATVVLFLITRNFTRSIDRLRIFTNKADKGETIETNITFPKDELGGLS